MLSRHSGIRRSTMPHPLVKDGEHRTTERVADAEVDLEHDQADRSRGERRSSPRSRRQEITGMGSKVRVLIVDDHPVVRQGIEAMLSTCEDIEVVAQASDGASA